MRARGAKVTDIVVLVVAADDGVMPQTVEAIATPRRRGVPIIVAINKIDKGDANPTRVKTELLQHEIQVEELGGEVLAVEVSADQGHRPRQAGGSDPAAVRSARSQGQSRARRRGAVIEAKLDKGRGPVATVLVQRGTLQVGDIVVAGAEWGRVRALVNDRGETVEQACPSSRSRSSVFQACLRPAMSSSSSRPRARAREVTEYRSASAASRARRRAAARRSLDQMFAEDRGRRAQGIRRSSSRPTCRVRSKRSTARCESRHRRGRRADAARRRRRHHRIRRDPGACLGRAPSSASMSAPMSRRASGPSATASTSATTTSSTTSSMT